MKQLPFSASVWLAIALAATATFLPAQSGTKPAPTADYGSLPLSFEANQGQSDPSVQFLSHGQGYTLFLRQGEAVLALQKQASSDDSAVVRMQLTGASHHAAVSEESPQSNRTNYFIGNNPALWHADIPNYGRVRYANVYDGIDLVYYGNQRRLEHDFIVSPNADPSRIALQMEGAKSLRIDAATGDLILATGHSELRLLKPVTYQESNGRRLPVSSSYKLLAKNKIGFSVGRYNHTQPLVIDPVLVYSTYLGGSGIPYISGPGFGDAANGIAVDSSGNAYLVGTTYSADFPVTTGSYQTSSKAFAAKSLTTIFVSELNSDGTALVYSTFFGGSGVPGQVGESGFAIALDADNNAYITGQTRSSDFPVTAGAFQTASSLPAAGDPAAFVTKLDSTGSKLIYSTYLAGVDPAKSFTQACQTGDAGTSIAVDATGNAYIAGTTCDADFPVSKGAFQSTNRGEATTSQVAFVTKLNSTGTGLVYSTFLGGSKFYDYLYGNNQVFLAIDSTGNAYVTGKTFSTDFPVTSGAFQTINRASPGVPRFASNAFITKLNPTGTGLVYSTFLGGSKPNPAGPYTLYPGDYTTGIAVDSNGSAYVAGSTTSLDFPVTPGVVVSDFSGLGMAFVSKLNPAGSALDYSTLIGLNTAPIYTYLNGSGTSGYVYANGLTVDGSGNAYVIGDSTQFLFPATQGSLSASGAFLVKLNPAATSFLLATVISPVGLQEDNSTVPNALVVDSTGNAYLAGSTASSIFPTTPGAYQTIEKAITYRAPNAFVSKFSLSGETTDHYPATMTFASSAASYQQGQPIVLTARLTGVQGAPIPTGTVMFSGAYVDPSFTRITPQTVSLDGTGTAVLTSMTFPPGAYSLTAIYSGDATYLTNRADSLNFENLASASGFSFCSRAVTGTVSVPAIGLKYGTPGTCTAVVTDVAADLLSGVTVSLSGPGLAFTPPSAVTDAGGQASFTITALAAGSTVATASVTGIPSSNLAPIPFTVAYAPLDITLLNISRTYGAANPVFPYKITGLVGADTVSVNSSTTANSSSPVGNYPVTATVSGPAASNYVPTIINSTLQIRKAALRLIPSPATRGVTYGSAIPSMTGYSFSGFFNGDTSSSITGTAGPVTTTATSTSTVGVYPLNVAVGSLSATNYGFAPAPGRFYIYKATLIATIQNVTIHQGDAIPAFTYSLSGFVNGDSASTAVTGAPVLSTTATSTSPPGKYKITGTLGTLASQNYGFSPVFGTLTILP